MTICYCWAHRYEQHWLTVRHQLLRYTQLNTRCLLTEQAKSQVHLRCAPRNSNIIRATFAEFRKMRDWDPVISCLTGNVATVSHAVKSHKLWHSAKHAAHEQRSSQPTTGGSSCTSSDACGLRFPVLLAANHTSIFTNSDRKQNASSRQHTSVMDTNAFHLSV